MADFEEEMLRYPEIIKEQRAHLCKIKGVNIIIEKQEHKEPQIYNHSSSMESWHWNCGQRRRHHYSNHTQILSDSENVRVLYQFGF